MIAFYRGLKFQFSKDSSKNRNHFLPLTLKVLSVQCKDFKPIDYETQYRKKKENEKLSDFNEIRSILIMIIIILEFHIFS